MKRASFTIGKVKISYVQVLYDNRYYKVSYQTKWPKNDLMIPACDKYIVEALVDGLMRRESGCHTTDNGGSGSEYGYLQKRFNNFLDRADKKDKWLDRE